MRLSVILVCLLSCTTSRHPTPSPAEVKAQGYFEIGAAALSRDPEEAALYFRQVQQLVPATSPLHQRASAQLALLAKKTIQPETSDNDGHGGVAIADDERSKGQLRPERVVYRSDEQQQQVDPSDFPMNEPRRSNDLFDNQQAEIDDDLARYGEDLYQAGVRLRKTRPAEAKRLFELAAHAAPDNAPLQQQLREQLASLGAPMPTPKPGALFGDPVPLPVKSSGSDTVESYLDRMAENLFQRAEQLKQKDPAAAANLYVRVLGMTLNRHPLHAKAEAALKALGR